MAIEIDTRAGRAELPEHLRDRPKDDPERMRFEKGWKAGDISWTDPEARASPFFKKPDKPVLIIYMAIFFVLCIAGYGGLEYYVAEAKELQAQIKETLASKGYYQNDPVVVAKFGKAEQTILLSELREMLAFAHALPPKGLGNEDEFTPLNSYLSYIEANNLPFNTREAIKWIAKNYR